MLSTRTGRIRQVREDRGYTVKKWCGAGIWGVREGCVGSQGGSRVSHRSWDEERGVSRRRATPISFAKELSNQPRMHVSTRSPSADSVASVKANDTYAQLHFSNSRT
eukprot:4431345-Pleurochrysis_carterae.AAC.2